MSKNVEDRILEGTKEDYIIMYFDENAQRYGANVATEMAIRNWYNTDPFYIKTIINGFYYGLKKEARKIYFPSINKLYNIKCQ